MKYQVALDVQVTVLVEAADERQAGDAAFAVVEMLQPGGVMWGDMTVIEVELLPDASREPQGE